MCDEICKTNKCYTIKNSFDICKRCPVTNDYTCNITTIHSNSNDEYKCPDDADECRNNLCRDVSQLQTIVTECGNCDKSDEPYKCHRKQKLLLLYLD